MKPTTSSLHALRVALKKVHDELEMYETEDDNNAEILLNVIDNIGIAVSELGEYSTEADSDSDTDKE